MDPAHVLLYNLKRLIYVPFDQLINAVKLPEPDGRWHVSFDIDYDRCYIVTCPDLFMAVDEVTRFMEDYIIGGVMQS